jgi:hypothetical protein
MGCRRFGGAGGDLQRLLAQDAQCLASADPANPMSLQDLGQTGLIDPGGLGGRGRQSPQRQEVPKSSATCSICG